MFVGMTPTVGIQMGLVLSLGLITRPFFRFNQVAGLITVYVSNPVTLVPIYWFDYKVGTLFLKGDVSYERFSEILKYNSLSEWWRMLVSLFVDVGAPLIVGSLIVAAVCALAVYPVMRALLRALRRERLQHRRAQRRHPVASAAD